MRSLIPIVLSASLLAAAPRTYLLPDNSDDAIAKLRRSIKEAKQNILIATPTLRERTLTRALESAAEQGVGITLVTSGEVDDALALVRYADVKVRILRGLQSERCDGRLAMTLLVIDNHTACLGTLPLSHEPFEHSIGLLECGSDPLRTERYNGYFQTMLSRSSPYLQP